MSPVMFIVFDIIARSKHTCDTVKYYIFAFHYCIFCITKNVAFKTQKRTSLIICASHNINPHPPFHSCQIFKKIPFYSSLERCCLFHYFYLIFGIWKLFLICICYFITYLPIDLNKCCIIYGKLHVAFMLVINHILSICEVK